MTNTTQIRAYIESQGLKLGHVARVLGIRVIGQASESGEGLTMEQRDACFFGPGTRMCQRKGAA